MQEPQQQYIKMIFVPPQNHRGKKMILSGLTYSFLTRSLFKTFNLSPDAIYHLYYFDREEDCITISSEQEFQIFVQSANKKTVYLERTDNSNLHFLKDQQSSLIPSGDGHIFLQKAFQQKKMQLRIRMQKFKEELEYKLQNQLKNKLKEAKLQGKKKKYINKWFKDMRCSKCQDKDIEGIRYSCIECNYNLCQNCQQDDNHPHPFYKIYDQSLDISQKTTEFSKKHTEHTLLKQQLQNQKQHPYYNQFRQVTNLDQGQSIKFLRKHPNQNLQTLLELYFQEF